MTRKPKTIVALCYGPTGEEYRYHVKPGTLTIRVPVCALTRQILTGLGHTVKEFHYQKIGVDQGKAIFVRE